MATISELARFLLDSDDIAVISHVSPDGDALGSALALTAALEKLGKRARAVFSDGVPVKYAFLPGADKIARTLDEIPFAPRCALSADVSEPTRMGAAREIFDSCAKKAVLDHHESNAGFGDISVIDGDRASTGELALEVIREMGVDLDRGIATNIYTAIMTDTGNFSYRNTSADCLAAAAECARAGADICELSRIVYRDRSLARVKLLGAALSRVKTLLGGKIAYTYVDEKMLAETGALLEEASQIVNYTNEITGVLVGVYAERRDGRTKFSLRSACPINVAREICVPLGGGGHDAAAGVTLDMPLEEAMEIVLDKTKKAVIAFENRN